MRLPSRTVPSCVKRADRLPEAALDRFQTGDERRRDRAHAGNQDSQLAFGGRNLDVVVIGQIAFSFKSKCYNTNSMRDRATATLTTVVVDDEKLACDELSFLLRDFPEIEVIATGSNGLEAVDLIQKLEPELVFLDVHMPGLDGMGVVRRLREKDIDLPHFIFVTAYDQYAVEAFRLEAHGLPAEARGKEPPSGNHRARPPRHTGDEGARAPAVSEAAPIGPAADQAAGALRTTATSSWTPTT